ncbi:XkdX family protein [Pediococcus pentosaceus]|nr:XkdX family protein [Pediococcus pentosaceus]MCT1175790.1 XkdX family protein [Pediococcus pentosaceus]
MDFPDFNSIKSWYNEQLWTKNMVSDAVVCNKITADQYKEITGEDYKAPES